MTKLKFHVLLNNIYEPRIHHGQHVDFAVGHQEQHLVHPVARVRDARVHEPDDVLVATQVALQTREMGRL